MRIYIANYASDYIKENRQWAFDSQDKANEFTNDLINGLKERDEIENTEYESNQYFLGKTTYGQQIRIYVEELELNQKQYKL
mgnify:FL=1|tara:strand:- start:39 stop:284 length:246 start_codon:yes stop_codon:yes gene_type:complete